jgi:hypothetical protein
MTITKILVAATPAILAAAAIALSFRHPIRASEAIAYGAAFGLGAIMVLEYGFKRRKLPIR